MTNIRDTIRKKCQVKRSVLALALSTSIAAFSAAPHAEAAVGDGVYGRFDAAVQDSGGASSRIWMAFSVVDPSPTWSANTALVSTKLGYSDDKGATYIDSGLLNPAEDLPDQGLSWINEVPTLVNDSSDPDPNARWKLVWVRYLMNNGTGDFARSWLAMRSAASPTGPWSAETKLIAGAIYDPNDPMNVEPRNPTYALPSSLADCVVVSEPGSLKVSDGFYLSLHCVTSGDIATTRTALMKFEHRKRGPTVLEVKGSLLTPDDARRFAIKYASQYPELADTVAFSATSLFTKNGVTYLLATPTKSTGGYMGCAVFQVTNLETASIARASTGDPQLLKYISGTPNTHRGACTYSAASTGGGVVLSQLDMSSPTYQFFNLVNTGVQVP